MIAISEEHDSGITRALLGSFGSRGGTSEINTTAAVTRRTAKRAMSNEYVSKQQQQQQQQQGTFLL